MMYKFLILCTLILITYNISFASESARIVRSTNSSLTIEVAINQNKLFSYTTEQNRIGYYQSVVLAVPSDGDISLSSLQLGSLKASKKNTHTLSLSTHDKIIEFSKPNYVRGQKYITVFIFPVTADGVYDNVELTVQFSGSISGSKNITVDSPFDKMLAGSVLNYEQSKSFTSNKVNQFSTAIMSGPFDGISNWVKIEVNQTGLYKLTGAQLDVSGMTITGQQSSDIHLYNGGGEQLPVANEIDRPLFNEVAIKIVDGGDGVFNSNDYILFYGESVNRWTYDTLAVAYQAHSYTEKNIYWLSLSSLTSGLRIQSVDGSLNGVVGGSVSQTFDRHTRRIHVEQNKELRRWSNGKTNDYYTWYWTKENSLSFFVATEHIITADPVSVSLSGKTIDTTGSSDDVGYIDLFVNNIKGFNKICNLNGCAYSSTSFVDGSNSIDMSLMFNASLPPYFNYLELAYSSYNQPVNNQLDITLGQMTGNTEIEVINSFASNPIILDISNPISPRELVLPTFGGSSFSFYDSLSQTKFNRYFLMPESQSLTPFSVSSITANDLYASSEQFDLLVISPKFLQPALSEYVGHRTSSGYTVKLVSVEDVMDNFGYGLFDPTAIRDFLKYTYENYPDPKPSAALLVGDATYDFLNNLSTNMPNYVPPFTHRIDNTSSDDNYVFFGDYGIIDSDTTYDTSQVSYDQGFDMMISRWPIRSSSDVQIVTNKIKSYESANNFGNWRNNITLVADDEYGSLSNEYFHTTQTEELEKYYLPPTFNRNKIYLWEYPFVNGEKPEVNEKIVSSFNNGSLLINYVGHGNPDVWSHENVFNRTGDLPKLNNQSKLALVLAASCDIGFYDDPLREGMAEELLSMSTGGAIGVISATRLVYSSDNAQFNRAIYNELFNDKSFSICQALYAAKMMRQYVSGVPTPKVNDRNYLFFGGPFVKLANPQYKINFTTQPDSLVALSPTNVVGTVVDNDGSPILTNGTIDVTVLDSKRDKTYQLKNPNGQVVNEVDYDVNGPTIFRGSATVTNGQFDFQFVPPLDIGFGGEGAQIMTYVSFETIDASGIIDSISISDSIAVTNDTIGPEIDATFSDHQGFVTGDIINKGESLVLEISDLSGINLAGGLGHGITLEIDNQPEKLLNLTSYFSYVQDSYNNGTLEYPLNELGVGVHSFKVKAWDNANNFAKVEFEAEIRANSDLEIVNLLNYPNPMRESTRFSFSLTQSVDNFVLDIFTLSGKKIKTFNRQYLEPTYYDDIVWYGKDVDGDRVATEVYIYKATAYPSGGGKTIESFGKIILVN